MREVLKKWIKYSDYCDKKIGECIKQDKKINKKLISSYKKKKDKHDYKINQIEENLAKAYVDHRNTKWWQLSKKANLQRSISDLLETKYIERINEPRLPLQSSSLPMTGKSIEGFMDYLTK